MGRQLALGISSVLAVVVFWELLVASGSVDPLVVSSPSRVASAAVSLWASGEFLNDIQTSTLEFVVGFVVALVLGVALGVPVGWYRRVRYLVPPAAAAAYAAPRVAILPRLVLWFGFGPHTTSIVVFLSAFFVVFINAIVATATVDPTLVRVARVYGASDRRVLTAVVLPAIFPSIVTSSRVAIAPALAGVVYGELYAASSGLGYFIHVTGATLQINKMFVALLLLAVVGLLLNVVLSRVEARFSTRRSELQIA
jgi:NitT/TauT family transport system permease protein